MRYGSARRITSLYRLYTGAMVYRPIRHFDFTDWHAGAK
jgi:hypothetical protein